MLCPKCNVAMVPGIALLTHFMVACLGYFYPVGSELKECLKCPKCGHSDDGEVK